MNTASDIYRSVAKCAQVASAISEVLRSTPNTADAAGDVVALEKDIAITRHFFEAMNEPASTFRGLDGTCENWEAFPTPAVLADSVELLDTETIDERPVETVVLLIDRLLMANQPNILRRHLGLISHPRFLVQTLYARALMALQRDEWETAVKDLELLQSLAPYFREVLHWRGRYHSRLEDWLKAAEYYDAEMSTGDALWTRLSVNATAVLVANENYRGFQIRFHNGMFEAVDLGKQRVIDLDKTRAVLLVRIAINEIVFRIRRRMGKRNRNEVIRMPHLHEVMNAVDELVDKRCLPS